jgi:hypothetical protein
VALCSLGTFSLAGSAWAQFDLPSEIVSSTIEPSAEQRQQIDAFIKPQLEKLASDEPEKVMQARRALVEPLKVTGNAGVGFRMAYGKALEPGLRAAVDSGKEMQQVNAIFIAGELGTTQSLTVIGLGRASTTPSVRFQAAAATRRLIENLREVSNSPLAESDQVRALRETRTALMSEQDALVQNAQLSALAAGVSVTTLQVEAAQQLAEAINQLARRASQTPASHHVVSGMERAVGLVQAQLRGAQNVRPQFIQAASDVAGSSLWHVMQVVQGGKVPAGEGTDTQAGRDSYARLAGISENLLRFCGTAASPAVTVPEVKLKDSLAAGTAAQDAAALKAVQGFLSDTLTKAPFDLKPARFR